MTPNEFKAWFDGFTEAFEGRIPSKAQWGRIKDRVGEIDGKAVTQTVYLDRYLPSLPSTAYPYVRPYWQYFGHGVCGTAQTTSTSNLPQNSVAASSMQQYAQAAQANNLSQVGSIGVAFNSLQAMADLGRAEAAEVA